jgi:predicted amidohydrolase
MRNLRLLQTLCGASIAIAAVASEPAAGRCGEVAGPMPMLERCETWTPDAHATPVTSRNEHGEVAVAGNGTHICCGGWQYYYKGVRAGQVYRLQTRVQYQGLDRARDSLVAVVLWGEWKRGEVQTGFKPWNYLVPKAVSPDTVDFQAVVKAPEDAGSMTIRYVFRWSEHGSSRWTAPVIQQAMLPTRKPLKICVLSETRQTAQRIKIQSFCKNTDLPRDVADSVDRFATLASLACKRKPDLVLTPEWSIGGKALVEGAVTVPGPATRPFEALAREHHVHFVIGLRERAGDTIYNSAVLIGPDGKIIGVYRKVHLATGEGFSGASPGNSFPVFETSIGRIGCLICMDTTVCESARMLALAGADFICFPIMGDLRADRWSPGPPVYSEDRWKAIMRTRAMDNQLCMVVARNGAQGSCVIDRKGDIAAWNEGDEEIIEATLPAEDGYRMWDGGDFREITFHLRRPHLYGAYCDESCFGLSKAAANDAAQPSPAAVQTARDLQFINTSFENASPLYWEIAADGSVQLYMLYDQERSSPNRAAGHWHFQVQARQGSDLRLVLNNFDNVWNGKHGSPHSDRTTAFISADGKTWQPVLTKKLPGDRREVCIHMDQGSLYVARLEPYRISDLEALKQSIRGNRFVEITPIGRTVEKRELEIIRVGRADAPHRVLLRARAHPWEPGGNWVVQGLIRRLLGDDLQARLYLDRYCVYVMPMANKDGVARGGTRFNMAGMDLNRNWDRPADPRLAPENAALEAWIEAAVRQKRRPELMIDFHNDEGGLLHVSRPNIDAEGYLGHMRLLEQLLREHTWFTEGSTGSGFHIPGTIGEGLADRYGITACILELNASWIAGLKDYATAKNWEQFGAQLAEVFSRYFESVDAPKGIRP